MPTKSVTFSFPPSQEGANAYVEYCEEIGREVATSSPYGTNLVGQLAKLRGVTAMDKPAANIPSGDTALVEIKWESDCIREI